MAEYIEPERWLPIEGFLGYYEVSSHGHVRSLDRYIPARTRTGLRLMKGRLLALTIGANGYCVVSLSKNGIVYKRTVHDLVLRTFIGPPPKSTDECLHGPNGKLDNYYRHLRWGSSSQNSFDTVNHGHHHQKKKLYDKWGHKLIAPNLTPSMLKHGYRQCLACNRAHTTVRAAALKGQTLDFRHTANRYYEQIMRLSV
jgi:hypothetical protein